MSRRQIEIDDNADRWRFRCPAGHTNWEATNGHFYCVACSRSADPDHEPVFHELRDQKTGDLVERSDLRLDGYEDHLRRPAQD